MDSLNDQPMSGNNGMPNTAINPDFDFSKYNIGTDSLGQEIKTLEQQAKGNRFPYEVFPLYIREIIEETNKCLGYPIDFIGTSMLFAASSAIGNTYRIRVKNGREESAILYFALVGPPGSNKTHPLDFAVKPLLDKDEASYRNYEEQKREYDRLLLLTKKEREGAGEPIKPVLQKIILRDFTPESLSEVHKYNKRGIGVCIDELAQWFGNFNRYNKGSEEQFWLSSWSASPITIDRKTSDPIYISLPFIPVIGTIQNGVLSELAKDHRKQNGFIDRILFAMPDDLERPYWSDDELDPRASKHWNIILSNILNIPLKLNETLNPDPEILSLSTEAKSLFVAWSNSNVDQIKASKGDEATQGVFSKLENAACRMALILELLSFGCNESKLIDISKNSMEGAIKLTEYFRVSALKVQDILLRRDPLEGLAENIQKLLEKLPQAFSTSDGLAIAKSLDISDRTFNRYLERTEWFKKVKHGIYEKLI